MTEVKASRPCRSESRAELARKDLPIRNLPVFCDLRAFLDHLDASGRLARVTAPVSTVHEITEIHRRVLRQGGPASPVLVNLFGTVERVAWGLGVKRERIPALGELLARLRQPEVEQIALRAIDLLRLQPTPMARAWPGGAEPFAGEVR